MLWVWKIVHRLDRWHSEDGTSVVAPEPEDALALFRALKSTDEIVKFVRGEQILGVKLTAEEEAAREVDRLTR